MRAKLSHTPIIGTGGVSSGQDGGRNADGRATVVGVGSAIYLRGENAIHIIRAELQQWMAAQNIARVAELHNRAHREPLYAIAPSTPPAPNAA